ncbi:MAG: heparinase II/III family protein [Lachnospiraceae bacterium]|nr:heparinase II/III family protein [Lachnospiraceae bacterium]
MFHKKARCKEFWKEVRSNPKYQVFINEILEIYEKYAQGDIKDISYDDFMIYHRTGKRTMVDELYNPRRRRLNACALLSLIYPEREEYFSNLMNTIWAVCNEYCWSLPMHTKNSDLEYNDDYIDLCAAVTGFELSEIRYLLGDRMSTLMNNRIHKEIEKRIINSFINHSYNWEKMQKNWSAVCAGNVACVFMYERPDLFWQIKPRIDAAMECFLSSFKKDGICREGLGYWEYGFSNFICYAEHLLDFTEGKINLYDDDHVKSIAKFVTVPFLEEGRVAVSFGDCGRTCKVSISTITTLENRYGGIADLVPKDACYHITEDWRRSVRSIVLYDSEEKNRSLVDSEYYASESGWFVKKNSLYGFAAKGGDNAEPHNHNDVGNFIFSHNGKQILADLGSGEYVKGYFDYSGGRYNTLCTRSGGHSVPILDGKEQSPGVNFAGKTSFDEGIFKIDLTHAYPKTAVSSIIREFSFKENGVVLKDTYVFDEECECKERLISLLCPEVKDGCIKLENVCIHYNENEWSPQVSSAMHRKPNGMDEEVYLIDFERKNQAVSVFTAEICVL